MLARTSLVAGVWIGGWTADGYSGSGTAGLDADTWDRAEQVIVRCMGGNLLVLAIGPALLGFGPLDAQSCRVNPLCK